MRYPELFKETLQDFKEGKYGEERRQLSLSEELVIVDAENYIFVCKKCGNWTEDLGLSLFAPNDVNKLKKKKYIKHVEEWGTTAYYMPYGMIPGFQEDYHLLKRYVHKCDKCGSVMHKATKKEECHLPCPECGGSPDPSFISIVNWD